MMQTKASFADPTDIPVSITLTATLGLFEEMSQAIGRDRPYNHATVQLLDAIRDVSYKLRKTMMPDVPEPKGIDRAG